jgi:desulfoferrodoxin (superoxide reductase-like protein)
MLKKMIIAGFAALPFIAAAHPPRTVELAYSKENTELTVTSNHPVGDSSAHYISVITVSLNKKQLAELKFDSQSSAQSHVAKFELTGAKEGDVVSVKSTCNKAGSKTAKLTIK